MELSLTALVNGVAIGSVVAILALSISQLFAVTGVVSFVHAAFAMVAAYVYAWMTQDHGWHVAVAATAAVALSAALGALVERIAYRRAYAAPSSVKFVLGVALLSAGQGLVSRLFGENERTAPPLLDGSSVEIGNVGVSRQQVLIVLITVMLVAVLVGALRYTRFGLATRATVEDRNTAEIVGVRTTRVSQTSWALGGGIAGMAGVLVAPLAPFSNLTFLVLIVSALAAVLFGGVRGLIGGVVGGLIIGFLETSFTLESGYDNAKLAIFFVVIAVVIIRRRWPAELQETRASGPAQNVPRRRLVPTLLPLALATALVIGWLLLIAAVRGDDFWGQIGTLVIVYVLGTAAVSVVTWSGQISLVHGPLLGVGAFSMLYLGAEHDLGLWPALGITVIVGALCGGTIGALTLRCPPVLTAIVSLSISTVMTSWLLPRYERDSGIVTIPSLVSSGGRLFTASAIVTILVLVLLWSLRRSSWGKMVLSVRDTPTMANHFAISEHRIRLSVWMLSGAIAALAGVLYSYFLLTITADAFGIGLSISLLLYAVLGGTRSLLGPFIAPLVFVAGPEALHLSDTSSAQLVAIASGLLVALLLVYRPEGVADIVGRITLPGLSKAALARRKPSARVASAVAPPATLVPARGYESPSSNGDETRASAALEARGLSVHLGGQKILTDVSLVVPKGCRVALIGPNGAGKTTLLNALSGACRATSGCIVVDGAARHRMTPRAAFRSGITRTFQNLELLDRLSTVDNVSLGLLHSRYESLAERAFRVYRSRARKTLRERSAESALSSVGLLTEADRPAGELAYGLRRRIEIARAVASSPSIVLLDEPTAGMDPAETRAIGELITDLAQRYGIATITVEHDMTLVEGYSDYVYVLQAGSVVAEGSPEAVLTDERVAADYLGIEATPTGGGHA